MWELIWSGLGSAVGGFLGVMAYRWRLDQQEAKPLVIHEYRCANEANKGQGEEPDFKSRLTKVWR